MFAERAKLLAGFAGAVLHWPPDVFWAATPDELAAIFECLAGDRAVPGGGDDLTRLKELYPDG